MPFSFAAKAFGIAKCRPLRRGLPLRSMCGRNLRFPHTRPLPFCDTIQFAIETDRSCHRQRPEAKSCSGLFLCSKFVAPVPADLNLPGSKKPPRGAFFWFVPPASPRQPFPNPCRRAALQNYSLFSILYSLVPPRPSPPTSRECQRAALSRGAEDQFPGSNAGLQNALSPPHSPACRAQAHSEPVPQSGTPQLFTLLYSLSQPCSFFPPGRTAKQKYILFFSLDT